VIPEPQRTYVLELLAALGPAAADFVIAGAQAIKFAVQDARGTKDVDFILNLIALRAEPLQLDAVLKQLGYTAVAGARNFQFSWSRGPTETQARCNHSLIDHLVFVAERSQSAIPARSDPLPRTESDPNAWWRSDARVWPFLALRLRRAGWAQS